MGQPMTAVVGFQFSSASCCCLLLYRSRTAITRVAPPDPRSFNKERVIAAVCFYSGSCCWHCRRSQRVHIVPCGCCCRRVSRQRDTGYHHASHNPASLIDRHQCAGASISRPRAIRVNLLPPAMGRTRESPPAAEERQPFRCLESAKRLRTSVCCGTAVDKKGLSRANHVISQSYFVLNLNVFSVCVVHGQRDCPGIVLLSLINIRKAATVVYII